jgi:hypothetical protein
MRELELDAEGRHWITPSAIMAHPVLGPLPPVRPSFGLAASLRRDALLLARRMTGSIEAFGLDVFEGATRLTA